MKMEKSYCGKIWNLLYLEFKNANVSNFFLITTKLNPLDENLWNGILIWELLSQLIEAIPWNCKKP